METYSWIYYPERIIANSFEHKGVNKIVDIGIAASNQIKKLLVSKSVS